MADPLAFAFSYFFQLLDVHSRVEDSVMSVIDEIQGELRHIQFEINEQISDGERRGQIAREITELSYRFDNTLGASIINAPEPDQRRHAGRWIQICFPKTWRSSAAKDFDEILGKIKAIRPRLLSSSIVHLSAAEKTAPGNGAEDVTILSAAEKDVTTAPGSGDVTAAAEDVTAAPGSGAEDVTIPGNGATSSAHEVVGRVKEIEQLLSYLCGEDSRECQVITISGIGGAGKTMLAQQLIERDPVRQRFANIIQIHVSRKFERRNIFMAILGHFPSSQDQIASLSEEQLARKISLLLEGYKVLLLLDDIWSVDDWKSLRIILPNVNRFNTIWPTKILITTRLKQLAKSAHSRGARSRWVHLDRLTEEDGCKLLEMSVPGIVFGHKVFL